MKFVFPLLFILLSACASKPNYPEDEWDDVFPDDPYCGEVLEDDCYYYPPYYY